MYKVDLTDTEYLGKTQSLDFSNRTHRELRGKYKANKRPPRGIRGTGRTLARGTTRQAVVVVQEAPATYASRLAKYGSTGVDYD